MSAREDGLSGLIDAVSAERNAAIQRAEQAEAKLALFDSLVKAMRGVYCPDPLVKKLLARADALDVGVNGGT